MHSQINILRLIYLFTLTYTPMYIHVYILILIYMYTYTEYIYIKKFMHKVRPGYLEKVSNVETKQKHILSIWKR